jgi:transcriptional regulator with XRE-family HTH domain
MISQYERGKRKPPLKAIYKLAELFEVSPNFFLEENNELVQTESKSESISEKLYSELKLQFEFLQRNFERVIEENGRLSRTLENLTSTGNFQEGSNLSVSPADGEDTALMAA